MTINQNLPVILDKGWTAIQSGKSLAQLQSEGQVFVVSDNVNLPFLNNSVAKVFSNSAPLGGQTILGPGLQSSEVARIFQSGVKGSVLNIDTDDGLVRGGAWREKSECNIPGRFTT